MRSGFVLSLVVAFVVLSLVADRGSRARIGTITGTVTEWRPGVSIGVANEQTDPRVRFVLRNTVYDGNTEGIRVGALVTVWFRSVGESHAIADRIRVLTEAIRH